MFNGLCWNELALPQVDEEAIAAEALDHQVQVADSCSIEARSDQDIVKIEKAAHSVEVAIRNIGE